VFQDVRFLANFGLQGPSPDVRSPAQLYRRRPALQAIVVQPAALQLRLGKSADQPLHADVHEIARADVTVRANRDGMLRDDLRLVAIGEVPLDGVLENREPLAPRGSEHPVERQPVQAPISVAAADV
jgi:hypothetical protein